MQARSSPRSRVARVRAIPTRDRSAVPLAPPLVTLTPAAAEVAACLAQASRTDGVADLLTADHRPGEQVVGTAALGQRVQVHAAPGIAGKRKPSPLLEERGEADLELRANLGDGGVRRHACLR